MIAIIAAYAVPIKTASDTSFRENRSLPAVRRAMCLDYEPLCCKGAGERLRQIQSVILYRIYIGYIPIVP